MKVEYLLGDHLGSTSLTTDANGAKVSEMRYKPCPLRFSSGVLRKGETRYTSGTTPISCPGPKAKSIPQQFELRTTIPVIRERLNLNHDRILTEVLPNAPLVALVDQAEECHALVQKEIS